MNRGAQTAVRTLLMLLLVSFGVAIAGDYDVDWYTIDGGGEMFCTGGNYELSGTIGQADASLTVMTGGDYELAGGFWPGAKFCFGDLDGDNTIGLSDLAILLSNYGTTSGMTYYDGDLDGDGDVDLADLGALLSVYGTICD